MHLFGTETYIIRIVKYGLTNFSGGGAFFGTYRYRVDLISMTSTQNFGYVWTRLVFEYPLTCWLPGHHSVHSSSFDQHAAFMLLHLRYIPHILTDELHAKRAAKAKELFNLPILGGGSSIVTFWLGIRADFTNPITVTPCKPLSRMKSRRGCGQWFNPRRWCSLCFGARKGRLW
jgi:hypothetical protein